MNRNDTPRVFVKAHVALLGDKWRVLSLVLLLQKDAPCSGGCAYSIGDILHGLPTR